jgi:predicted PolB exonuclease-like 3'-5' exonuclease
MKGINLLKSMQDEVWVFDAEWVPDPVAGRLLYHLPESMDDWEVVQEMWRQNGATAENPRPYLKTILCRVVSIATVIRHVLPDKSVRLRLFSLPQQVESPEEQDEAVLLSRFLTGLGKHKPQIVGFNSQAADLKVFIQRGLVHGLSVPAFCHRPAKPWEGVDYFARTNEWHVDLLEVISGWGNTVPSLHQLALLAGIPGKMDIDGRQIADLWRNGELQRIVHYNECDALTTYLLWLRLAHFAGFFTTQAYSEEQDRVRSLLAEKAQDPRHAHLIAYQETWDLLQGHRLRTAFASSHAPVLSR